MKGGLTLVQGQGTSFWPRIVCWGLEQTQKPTWFHAGTKMQAQECLGGGGVNNGRIQASSAQGPRCGHRSVCWGI